MYASIILATTALLGAVSAAPLNVVRTATTTYPAYWNTSSITNTTSNVAATGASVPLSTASAAPAPSVKSFDVIYPDYTSQYNAATGAVDFHTARGFVSRSTTNHGADISTLVTFQLDKKYADKQCQLVFDLENPSSWASGSMKAQLFTSLAPATADSASWPSGNLRNEHLGSIIAQKGGRAVWEAGSGPAATSDGKFPCKMIAGMVYGGEIVPQGDNVEISWPAGKDGVKIVVY